MEIIYWLIFFAAGAAVLYLEFANSKSTKQTAISSTAFLSFRNNYLLVYSLMMAGDWLQGPYVYALYAHYGYAVGDIGKLFIAGFGASMIFGTVVGSLADKFGRKKAALLYVVTYAASCVTKHWSDYNVLMLGRFFGGIATSLLMSAFESWLVAEHFKRAYEEEWLNTIFSKSVFLGNGLVAILSGLLANFLVDNFELGPVAPFDAAFTFLIIGGGVIMLTWTENFGEAASNADSGGAMSQFSKAFKAIKEDRKIILLGALQSLFEGSMYTFVFLWTPALSPHGEKIPHGFIFATFMVFCMCGSSVAGRLLAGPTKPETYMQVVLFASSIFLLVPVLCKPFNTPPAPGQGASGITPIGVLQYFAFCCFEFCVGIFWPSLMKMRSKYIPEEARATIMNFFRIPLNLFVCIVLYNVSAFPLEAMFGMCFLFLLGSTYAQRELASFALGSSSAESGE